MGASGRGLGACNRSCSRLHLAVVIVPSCQAITGLMEFLKCEVEQDDSDKCSQKTFGAECVPVY